ncbi:hypothetical protein E2C01_089254 [Portunus trituberculatus]|uniref:Uncharacterized protein n=1 Tax=Portunus trituberculatus TaxID=210409 RepID=A0A5B7JD15_PORTR|nr:hypothetical protein [Portunus trituberculatus]
MGGVASCQGRWKGGGTTRGEREALGNRISRQQEVWHSRAVTPCHANHLPPPPPSPPPLLLHLNQATPVNSVLSQLLLLLPPPPPPPPPPSYCHHHHHRHYHHHHHHRCRIKVCKVTCIRYVLCSSLLHSYLSKSVSQSVLVSQLIFLVYKVVRRESVSHSLWL